MPPKTLPKQYHLLLKTHQLTIFLAASPLDKIASLKTVALTALQADVNEVEDVPLVNSETDFEICRAMKDKTYGPVMLYELLNGHQVVKDVLSNWEHIYIRFKGDSGELLPVKVSPLSILDDEDEQQPIADGSMNKGKRKAPE